MFLGREKELESLRLLLRKPTASLVACRGRRRIGKSTLFREFARRNRAELLVIEGLDPEARSRERQAAPISGRSRLATGWRTLPMLSQSAGSEPDSSAERAVSVSGWRTVSSVFQPLNTCAVLSPAQG